MTSPSEYASEQLNARVSAIQKLKYIRELRAQKNVANLKKCYIHLERCDSNPTMDPNNMWSLCESVSDESAPSSSRSRDQDILSSRSRDQDILSPRSRDQDILDLVHFLEKNDEESRDSVPVWSQPYPCFEYISPPPSPKHKFESNFRDISSPENDQNDDPPSPILSRAFEPVSSSESLFDKTAEDQIVIDLTAESPPPKYFSRGNSQSPKITAIVKPFNRDIPKTWDLENQPCTSRGTQSKSRVERQQKSRHLMQANRDRAKSQSSKLSEQKLQALIDKINNKVRSTNSKEQENARSESSSPVISEPGSKSETIIDLLETGLSDRKASDCESAEGAQALRKQFNEEIGQLWSSHIEDISPNSKIDQKGEIDRKREIGQKREFGQKRETDRKREIGQKREIDEKPEIGEKCEIDLEREIGQKREIDLEREISQKREIDLEREIGDPVVLLEPLPNEEVLRYRLEALEWEKRKIEMEYEKQMLKQEREEKRREMKRKVETEKVNENQDERLEKYVKSKRDEILKNDEQEKEKEILKKNEEEAESSSVLASELKVKSYKPGPISSKTFYKQTDKNSDSDKKSSLLFVKKDKASSLVLSHLLLQNMKKPIQSKRTKHDPLQVGDYSMVNPSIIEKRQNLAKQTQLKMLQKAKEIKNKAIIQSSPKTKQSHFRNGPKVDPQSLLIRKSVEVAKKDKDEDTFESPLSQILGPEPVEPGPPVFKPKDHCIAPEKIMKPVFSRKRTADPGSGSESHDVLALKKSARASKKSVFESPLTQILGPDQIAKTSTYNVHAPIPYKGHSDEDIDSSTNPTNKKIVQLPVQLHKPNPSHLKSGKSCLKDKLKNDCNKKEIRRVHFVQSDVVTQRWYPVVEDYWNIAEVGGKLYPESGATLLLREVVDRCILRWNPNWLQEYVPSGSKNLPNILEDMSVMDLDWDPPMVFQSYQQYKDRLLPLLLMEIWETVYCGFRGSKNKPATEFHVMPSESTNTGDVFRKLRIGRISETGDFLNLYEDDLLIIQMHNYKHSFFALVENVQPKFKIHAQCPTYLKHLVEENLNQDSSLLHIEQYDINLKNKSTLPANMNGIASVKIISKLKSDLRFVHGLAEVDCSPLLPILLHPSGAGHQVQSFMGDALMAEHTLLNESQEEVVRCISRDVIYNVTEPRIALVHGPPGTGKSRTILALLQEIHVRKRELTNGKKADHPLGPIIVCAPSNGAVDELARHLIKLNETVGEGHPRYMNFVRVGSEQISDDVKRYSLDSLAQGNVRQDWFVRQKKNELQDCNSRLSKLVTSSGNPLPSLAHVASSLRSSIRQLESEINTPSAASREVRKMLIDHANVIAVTLNSCGGSAFEGLVKPACVIIDEACQSTELETLIPLQFGCNKLILVGDPEQLPPTVKSKSAAKRHLGESLFERCKRCLMEEGREDAIKFLNEQYRMVKDIAMFPSRHVYDNRLVTPMNLVPPPNFNLVPYMLFNVKYGVENKESAGSSSTFNSSEAEFIVETCKSVLRMSQIPPTEIGIITFYKAQVTLIDKRLKQTNSLRQIEVNTVDGFQGREKSIIILSCVRSREGGSVGFLSDHRRMNVAITRAKYGMYIVGNCATLKRDQNWKELIKDAYVRKRVLVVKDNSSKSIERALTGLIIS